MDTAVTDEIAQFDREEFEEKMRPVLARRGERLAHAKIADHEPVVFNAPPDSMVVGPYYENRRMRRDFVNRSPQHRLERRLARSILARVEPPLMVVKSGRVYADWPRHRLVQMGLA